MMNLQGDPNADIYVIMDKAKLTAGHVLTAKQPTSKTIEDIRNKIAKDVTEYIRAREAEMELNNGTQR